MNQTHAADVTSTIRKMVKDVSYETLEIIFREAHHELQERFIAGNTK